MSRPEAAENAGDAAGVARALIAVAALVLLAAGLYGIASPFISGHYGYHGGEYATRARHTIRHGSLLPANVPRSGPPRPEDYYLHHPILTHQLVTLTLLVLGDHEYAVRAAGLLACLACFLLLTRLVWRHWGPMPAALAAMTFVVVPINVWFANHIDPGYPSIAALLAFFGFYLSWLREGRRRDAAGALVFVALAGGLEWSPYLACVPVFVHALWTGLRRRGSYLRFVPLYALAVVLPPAGHALVAWRTGHVSEMLESFEVRTSGGLGPSFYLRSYETAVAMFGTPLLLACGVWVLLLVFRIASGRGRARDLLGTSFLFAFLAYLHIFRSGALIHPYRYLYGGVVCVVAVVDLAEALSAAAAASLPPGRAPAARAVAWAVGLALVGFTLPAAHRALFESRMTGGVPFAGAYDPGTRKIAFAEVVRDVSRPGDVLYLDPTFEDRHWGLTYYLDRDSVPASLRRVVELTPAERRRALFLCVPAALSPADRLRLGLLARAHAVRDVSGFLLLDLRRPGPDLHAETAVPPVRRTPLRRYLEGPHPRLEREPNPAKELTYGREFGRGP